MIIVMHLTCGIIDLNLLFRVNIEFFLQDYNKTTLPHDIIKAFT